MIVSCWFGWDPRDTPKLTIPFAKSLCWWGKFEVTDLGIQELLCALAFWESKVTPGDPETAWVSVSHRVGGVKTKKMQNRGRYDGISTLHVPESLIFVHFYYSPFYVVSIMFDGFFVGNFFHSPESPSITKGGTRDDPYRLCKFGDEQAIYFLKDDQPPYAKWSKQRVTRR